MRLRGSLTLLGVAVCLLVVVPGVLAQQPDTSRLTESVGPSDITRTPASDTLRDSSRTPPDSLQQASQVEASRDQDSPTPDPSGNESNAVSFSARDSLVIRSDSATSDRGTLHGESNMSYQGTTVRARTIGLDFQTGTLQAEGAPSDTLAGGRPVFEQSGGQSAGGSGQGGNQSFTGNVLSYNLNTERGRVVAGRTQRKDAFVEGGAVKLFEDSTLFVRDGSYTTCDCPADQTPSYSLRSDEMKIQGKWVYTGPIQLYLFNVPTPLWLPFGFLPNVRGRRSGPLPPEYGEDRRGFFLKNWGWYFALNAYTDLTLRASVWSKGSFEIRPRFRYRKRYNYNGGLELTYRRVRIGESEDPSPTRRHEGQLRWNHSQDISPTASLRGKVNLATTGDFAQRNAESYEDAVRQEISSNLRYQKTWPEGDRQLNVSAQQTQQLQSGEVRLTAPNLNFSQGDLKPFKAEQRIGDERWYEKITTSYSLDVTNNYNFQPRDPDQLRTRGTERDSMLADEIERADVDWYEALFDREKYETATGDEQLYDFQATHRIPLNATFRLDRYNFSLTPSFNYTSDWYTSTVRRVARDSTGPDTLAVTDVVERRKPGFYARRDFNASLSAGTELFGTFPIGLGQFEGLRHRINPSLSANYKPNFNDPVWGRTRPLRFEDGTVVPNSLSAGGRYDIVEGSRADQSTQQFRLDLSLNNVFETKRVRVDTTGRRQTETLTLLNLDVSGLSYNFAADSFRVGERIRVNARTRIEPFNISARSTFSPYVLERRSVGDDRTFRQADRLMVSESPLTPARLTNFRLNLSVDFSSDGSQSRRSAPRRRQPQGGGRTTNIPSQSGRNQRSANLELSDFDPTWSLSADFNYNLDKPRKEITNRNATLGLDLDLNVTPLWRVSGETGYDFISDNISTTRLSINRNLGCWNMSFSWVPFGRYQQYSFTLQVNSGQLSDLLKLQVPNQGGEGRFGGFGDQLRNTAQGAAGVGGGGQSSGGGFP
ncbi:MAG: hypothetical protein BRD35_01610 [Bacteroidetes bacterium QH_7_62_13]|nr:MAG: hypothetical protein BRD35_01610 [Bacteroidetes bacterium QH_7_62_13]